ncbi:peroxiredoxin-like family protein [Paraburkholderia sp. BCC1884]|uniref:peroxiredoxin-like family protein n=1 Tax=Paraburkholderia sp. BCC1884 TaxID=2562668 RepID=UPI0011837280|nr:peroxiredoxin-like family protein [Paraburkholderia sp. BCC1884]
MEQFDNSAGDSIAARTVAAAFAASGNALRAGDHVPAFSLPDTDGGLVPVDRLLHRGPLVLWFTRGLWCSYTNDSLRDISDAFARLITDGALGAVVLPLSESGMSADIFSVPRLMDPELKLMRDFGLTFELPPELQATYLRLGYTPPMPKGRATGTFPVPIPATYLIDQSGTVVFTQSDVDYRNGMNSGSLLTALHGLQVQRQGRADDRSIRRSTGRVGGPPRRG